MPTFEIVEGKIWHCGQIARRLRRDHQRVFREAGIDAHQNLRDVFVQSPYCRAWLIDGKLAALGGYAAPMASFGGYVWLALTEEATQHRVEIVREAKRQLRRMLEDKIELATTIVENDPASLRFAIFLGFHVSHGDEGEPAANRGERRRLLSHLASHRDNRLPLNGSGIQLIPMGYHDEGQG